MSLVLGIRYLTTSFGARRRSRIELGEEATLALRVRIRDCDWYGHVNNGRYLSLMDLGRIDYVVRCGMLAACREHGWKPVAAGATIRFRRELRFRARYTLSTRLIGWDDSWWFFEQRFERADGALAAKAYAKIAMLDASGKRVDPANVIAAVGFEAPSPELPSDVLQWLRTSAS